MYVSEKLKLSTLKAEKKRLEAIKNKSYSDKGMLKAIKKSIAIAEKAPDRSASISF